MNSRATISRCHNRYVQYTVTKQLQKDEIPYLVPNAFTIASADNLDCKQPHATVYSGDQSWSWHGTTMQLVQPKPHSLLNPNPTFTGDHDYLATQYRFASRQKRPMLDTNEGSTVKKVCRRARTLTEGPHPASELLINIPECTPVQPLLQLSFRYPELQGKSGIEHLWSVQKCKTQIRKKHCIFFVWVEGRLWMFTLLCLSLTDCVSSTIIFQICGSSDSRKCEMSKEVMSNGASASLAMSALICWWSRSFIALQTLTNWLSSHVGVKLSLLLDNFMFLFIFSSFEIERRSPSLL